MRNKLRGRWPLKSSYIGARRDFAQPKVGRLAHGCGERPNGFSAFDRPDRLTRQVSKACCGCYRPCARPIAQFVRLFVVPPPLAGGPTYATRRRLPGTEAWLLLQKWQPAPLTLLRVQGIAWAKSALVIEPSANRLRMHSANAAS